MEHVREIYKAVVDSNMEDSSNTLLNTSSLSKNITYYKENLPSPVDTTTDLAKTEFDYFHYYLLHVSVSVAIVFQWSCEEFLCR